MRLPRVVRTVTFKLALTQAALFAASAVVLFAAVYWSMINYATAQLEAAVAAELVVLTEELSTDGLPELIKTLDLRAKERMSEGHGYVLLAPDGRRIAGNLSGVAAKPGWQTIVPVRQGASRGDDEAHAMLVSGTVLPNGDYLAVGRDTRDIDDIEELISQTFAWAAGVTLALALLGGVLTSFGVLRRIETINATTRKIMEGDLAKRVPKTGTGDEFDRLAANLNEMLDRIQSLMEGLRQVSNGIAHDLRTPLTHLRQRLEEAKGSARSIEAYEAIVDATITDCDAILKIFAALLRIAQIEAGTRRSGFGDVDLSRVFASILEIYGPVAEDAGQSLAGAIDVGLHVRGDSELLTQMLANLVENAIKHSPAGSTIDLRLERRSPGPRGVVADDGPGVSAEARDKVFERFFKADRSRSSDGSGLGLSLVRAVADLHGIRIELRDNRPGLRAVLEFGG